MIGIGFQTAPSCSGIIFQSSDTRFRSADLTEGQILYWGLVDGYAIYKTLFLLGSRRNDIFFNVDTREGTCDVIVQNIIHC